MKRIGEHETNKGADILISIIPEIGKITADSEYISMVKKMREASKAKKGTKAARFDPNNLVVFLLSKHRATTWNLLAILGEKTIEEIQAQTFRETSQQLNIMLGDPEILGFFTPLSLLEPEAQSDISPK